MSDESLHRLAATQHAVFSRPQGLRHLSSKALRRRIELGIFETVHESVYRVAGSPITWRQKLMAAQLAAGADSAIGFLAAGALWGMPEIAEDAPEVIVPAPRNVRWPGIRTHVTVRDGVPVTTPARTLFDLSAVVGRCS